MAARLSLFLFCRIHFCIKSSHAKGLTTIYSLDKIKSWKPLYINGIADALEGKVKVEWCQ